MLPSVGFAQAELRRSAHSSDCWFVISALISAALRLPLRHPTQAMLWLQLHRDQALGHG